MLMPKLPLSLASRLCAVLSPARTKALSSPAPAALQRKTTAAAVSTTPHRSAFADVVVTRLAPSSNDWYPEYDRLMPCPAENMMPRVDHLVALKEGNVVDFVSKALNLPPLYVTDLIHFGAVYYALVCPTLPSTATPEQIRVFKEVTDPTVLKKRSSIKGKTVREAQKTFKVTDPNQFLEAGTYLWVHVHPKRFPRCYEVDWRSRVIEITGSYVVLDKPAGTSVGGTTDNMEEECCATFASPALGFEAPLITTHQIDNCTEGCSHLQTLAKLISFQRWSHLQSLTGISIATPASFSALLVRLLALSPPFPAPLLLRLAHYARRRFPLALPLPLHSSLLLSLLRDKMYSQLRSELHYLSRYRLHPPSALLHSLAAVSSPDLRRESFSLIADMLTLALIKNSRLEYAVESFFRSGDYGLRLSTLSVNPLLSSLIKEGRTGVAEKVFDNMLRRKIRPNLITLNTMINGLCKAGKLRRAADLLEDVRCWGFEPSVVTYNTLLDGYCKKGQAGKMYKADALLKVMVLNGVTPNVVTFNTLIDGYCKDLNCKAALRFFEEMKRQRICPNLRTYNTLITGFCGEGKIDEAIEVLREMVDSNLVPNLFSYNSIINGFCKKGKMDEAESWFGEMVNRNIEPNLITYNTLIDGYCRYGMASEAFDLKVNMENKGINPDILTYNCLICGLCKMGDMKRVSELLNEMEEKEVKANLATYNVLIKALCEQGNTVKAIKLLDEMYEVGVEPKHVTYNTLIEGLCKKGNIRAALNMRHRMEKARKRANVVTYNVLMKYYCGKGELSEANELLNEMLEKGLVPNRVTYDIIKEGMVEKGYTPDVKGYSFTGDSKWPHMSAK